MPTVISTMVNKANISILGKSTSKKPIGAIAEMKRKKYSTEVLN
jgi:hypothetical protein